jgi:ammonium transporter
MSLPSPKGIGRFAFRFVVDIAVQGHFFGGHALFKHWIAFVSITFALITFASLGSAQDAKDAKKPAEDPAAKKDDEAAKKAAEEKKAAEKAAADINDGLVKGDSAWMMVATAFVMLMVPGLALFYGGMVRRKNILATMMQSMVALSVVGVFWVAIGYSLAFGPPLPLLNTQWGSVIGFSPDLVFLYGIKPDRNLEGTNIPVYLHMLYQGMFAIITPALISGAVAERIRFKPYCIFLILWIVLVYCPLAHSVWANDYWVKATHAEEGKAIGETPVGILGRYGALDFAGGTVVHIAAGFSGLAAILMLRKRLGYPEHAMHPNSMVLTLSGAGILWFGWFGFNGGSGLTSGPVATAAFAATQCAAAAAGLSWMLAEWFHRGKPTALGLASGIVAGLVAVTPASGFVLPWAGFCIGIIAGIVCYVAVSLKPVFKYDDSLDAFGVHGVGGFLGAVLTGVFCYETKYPGLIRSGESKQVVIQLVAAAGSAVLAFVVSLILVKGIDLVMGFLADDNEEIEGLDRTEHGETGFDFGYGYEVAPATAPAEPRPAIVPPIGSGRFQIVVEGIANGDLMHAWSTLCLPTPEPSPEFKAIYPNVTTVQGNRFRFRGGDKERMKENLQKLFEKALKRPLKVKVEA